ncbi:MAG TPA: hypothetical protein VIF57_15355 [Polyangia bacterium]
MLAADTVAAPPPAPVAAVEISYLTHAGEGASGQKRFTRDGCYQVESGGSTGGSSYARDSHAGCHLPTDVAAAFGRLDAIAADTLAREGARRGGDGDSARAPGRMPGGLETTVVLIRTDGTRWAAANRATADEIQHAVNQLPDENQWNAQPPQTPIGKGGQLLFLSAPCDDGGGTRRLEASLASDGRWWCHRSLVGDARGEPALPARRPPPLPGEAARARLGRILKDAVGAAEDWSGLCRNSRRLLEQFEPSVEVAWAGKARGPLQGSKGRVVKRFVNEMKSVSPICSDAPEQARRR